MARKISIQIVGDSRSLVKAFKKSRNAADGFSHHVRSIMGAASKGILALVGAAAGLAVAFGIKSVKAAMSLQSAMFRVNAVFGKSARGVHRWAEGLTVSMGLSADEAETFVGSIGNTIRGMGVGQSSAAKMSKRFTQLAVDMAAFNKASPEDTMKALQRGMTGMTRGLKQFGIVISTADVKQKALEMTHKKDAKTLTNLDMANARYALILQKSARQTGAFHKQSGRLPQVFHSIRASVKNLEERFGLGLLPVVQKVARILRTKLADPKFMAFVQRLGNMVGNKLYNAFLAIGKWFMAHWPGIKKGFHQAYLILKKMVGAIKWIAENTPNTSPSANPLKGGAFFKRDIFSDSQWKALPSWAKQQFAEKGYTRTHDKQGHIHIYLDGREITKSVTKNQQRSGKSAPHQTRGRHGGNAFAIPG